MKIKKSKVIKWQFVHKDDMQRAKTTKTIPNLTGTLWRNKRIANKESLMSGNSDYHLVKVTYNLEWSE